MAARALSALDSYIYGFALQQVSLPFENDEELAEIGAALLREVNADEHPYLAEMIREHVLKPHYDYAAEFELGLNLILAGLEELRGTV